MTTPVQHSALIDPARLLAMANEYFGKGVDCDIAGRVITDFQVLLHGAYRPAVIRLLNLAVSRHPAGPTLPQEIFDALATEAYALEVDIDFSGQSIQSYAILFEKTYGFGRQVNQLVELAREHAPILRMTPHSRTHSR